MPIAISLCDDDSKQVAYLRELLARWSADKPFAIHINEYESAEEFLFDYPDNPCSLLLLDIEMRGINGMELAKKLREKNDMLPIIFITGYSEYISDGYDVEALHYLLKPLNEEKLFAVLDKYIRRHSVKSEEILVTSADGSAHISADSISYIEAFGRKTQIHLSDNTVIDCNMGIGKFEDIRGFIHSHRSYIVNLRYVRSIGKASVFLDFGVEVPLSRRLYNEVNKKFIEFYTGDNQNDDKKI